MFDACPSVPGSQHPARLVFPSGRCDHCFEAFSGVGHLRAALHGTATRRAKIEKLVAQLGKFLLDGSRKVRCFSHDPPIASHPWVRMTGLPVPRIVKFDVGGIRRLASGAGLLVWHHCSGGPVGDSQHLFVLARSQSRQTLPPRSEAKEIDPVLVKQRAKSFTNCADAGQTRVSHSIVNVLSAGQPI
jgi:hypothetical protein